MCDLDGETLVIRDDDRGVGDPGTAGGLRTARRSRCWTIFGEQGRRLVEVHASVDAPDALSRRRFAGLCGTLSER